VTPQAAEESVDDPGVGRMSLYKQFHGDLQAIARGQMLATMGEVKGSAAYVAIDRVTGSLHGRDGGFSIQHCGVMNRGVPQLSISIVPDSGVGDLAGITGTMAIRIEDGQHFYDLDYELPEIS
jgi:Protein of unknown function (DUF3224)